MKIKEAKFDSRSTSASNKMFVYKMNLKSKNLRKEAFLME